MLHASNNPGLVSDCNALLAARDALAGSAALNWLANRPIDLWEGVTVGGSPLRVTVLDLSEKGLTGKIPGNLGDLANLQGLILVNNQLTGPIPTELGGLASLQRIYLNQNQLSGEIPAGIGNPLKPAMAGSFLTTNSAGKYRQNWAVSKICECCPSPEIN